MEISFHQKLDDILNKLEAVGLIKEEMKCLKTDLLQQSKRQDESVRRLAGNFEHLLNTQREMLIRLRSIEECGRRMEKQMGYNIDGESYGDLQSLTEEAGGGSLHRGELLKEGSMEAVEQEILSLKRSDVLLSSHENSDEPIASFSEKHEKISNNGGNSDSKPAEVKMSDEGVASSRTIESETTKNKNLFNANQSLPNGHNSNSTNFKTSYKCHSCSTFLVRRKNNVCVKCPNFECRKWNIAGTLNPGNKWIALANPCGHVQQVPTASKVGEIWTCTQCSKSGKIDYVYQIKKSEEVIVDDTDAIEELDDHSYMCGKCLEPLPSPAQGQFIVTCPTCQNGNNLSYAFLQETMTTISVYMCVVCFNELPSSRIEDGVSVQCEHCHTINCAGAPRPGHRWVRLLLTKDNPRILVCNHAQQLPIDHPELSQWKCKTCGAPGYITDAANLARVYDIPINGKESYIYKCRYCKTVLPEPKDNDNVRVSCLQCKNLSIVGTLQDGFKWIFLKPCKHFQQTEKYNKAGETMKCNLCGKQGTICDVQPRWIPLCEKKPTDAFGPSKILNENNHDNANQVIYDCRNCNIHLPQTPREDGVSTECPKCQKVYMTGNLETGNRWAFCQPCGHCIQVRDEITEDGIGLCSVCKQPRIISVTVVKHDNK